MAEELDGKFIGEEWISSKNIFFQVGCYQVQLDEQSEAVNELLLAGKVDPCLSGTYSFDEIGHAHQLMYENKHPYGNMGMLSI